VADAKGMRTSLGLASLVLLLGVGACNQVETGRRGQVTFTPDDCGAAGCSFGDPLAIGGMTAVDIAGAHGNRVDDPTLCAGWPGIVDVQAGAPRSGRFQLLGVGDGTADLLAMDPYGTVVDSIRVDVRQIDDLDVDLIGDGAAGPDAVVGADAY